MTYYAKEMIAEARKLDLLTYFRVYEPGELIRLGANSYGARKHSSLKLSNGKWFWWAGSIGGVSALDYLVKVEGMEFTKAVAYILRLERIPVLEPEPIPDEQESLGFALPEPCVNNNRVINYLLQRGIDIEILHVCIAKGLLYEAEPYHNAVFVGFDDGGKAAYAAYRSIHKNRIMGEVRGSRKAFSFRIIGTQLDSLHVFESAIDVLSYLTLVKEDGEPWKSKCCLSLGGISNFKNGRLPAGLEDYLKKTEGLKTINLHFDHDDAGHRAAKYLQETLTEKYEVRLDFPACGKDVNDELRARKAKKREERVR